jgi:hypothetical protein
MIIKRPSGIVILSLPLAISIMTCFGITLGTFTPTSPSPTSPPSPTETLFPVTTNTAVIATPTVASTVEEPFSGQVNVLEINGFKDETDHWYFMDC